MLGLSANGIAFVTLVNIFICFLIGHFTRNDILCNKTHDKKSYVLTRFKSRMDRDRKLVKDVALATYSTSNLVKFRYNILGNMTVEYPEVSLLIQRKPFRVDDRLSGCKHIFHTHVSTDQDCSAYVFIQPNIDTASAFYSALNHGSHYHPQYSDFNTFHQIRYNANWRLMRRLYAPKESGRLETAGYFKVVGHAKGRSRLREKMKPFLANLREIENYLFSKLLKHGILNTTFVSSVSSSQHQRTDIGNSTSDSTIETLLAAYKLQSSILSPRHKDKVVLMVVNEGELDLLTNFACSCHKHRLSLRR